MLHSLVEEIKCVERDSDVCWPTPGALFYLVIKSRHGLITLRALIHTEDEHTRQHLVENDSHSPDINLMAVARTASPICLKLLWSHHER